MTRDVLSEIDDGIAVLTLHRPQQRNAWTAELGQELSRLLRLFDGDDAVRVIVLTGAGDAFCAGADLSAGTQTFATPGDHFSATPLNPPLFGLRTPVVAAVNGHALGIGLTLALQADIRVVAADARYGVVQARWGVVGDMMVHWLLPRIVGASMAAELLLTGRTVDGHHAVRLGLASQCLPASQVLSGALDIARVIVRDTAPASAELSKALLWQGLARGANPDQMAAAETTAHHRVMGLSDTHEAVTAKQEGRSARWSAPADDLLDGLW